MSPYLQYNSSCDIRDDQNPLEELFNVLKPSFKRQSRDLKDRDLPRSFFNPSRPRTINPKREEAIRRARSTHFQSLRRIRNSSTDKDSGRGKIDKVSHYYESL